MATNKKTRDEAILLLQALASRRTAEDWTNLNFFGMSEQLDTSTEALSLARDCFDHVPSLHACIAHNTEESAPHAFELECAQAAILMFEGWEKGNTVKEAPRITRDIAELYDSRCGDELEGLN